MYTSHSAIITLACQQHENPLMKPLLIFAAIALCANAAPTDLASASVETINSGFDVQGNEYEKANLNYSTIDKRKAIGNNEKRWPDAIIPYRIDASSEPDRGVIEAAIHHWESNACIRFVNYTTEGPHVTFKKLDRCSSHLGYQNHNTGQLISIGAGCNGFGTIVHEIGHTVGFHHEHTRPDRGEHVLILEKNIKSNYDYPFIVRGTINTYGVPYDMGSIMHYGPGTFAKPNKNGIVSVDPFKQFHFGSGDELTFWDIKLANLMYNCSDSCEKRIKMEGKTPLICVNGGFLDEYCTCVCPPRFSGDTCNDGSAVEPAALTCGGEITEEIIIQVTSSPSHLQCVWVIEALEGEKVEVFFPNFDLVPPEIKTNGSSVCEQDIFELRIGEELNDGDRFCGTELQDETIISATHKMVILFSKRSNSVGFEAEITFVA